MLERVWSLTFGWKGLLKFRVVPVRVSYERAGPSTEIKPSHKQAKLTQENPERPSEPLDAQEVVPVSRNVDFVHDIR